MVEMKVNTNFDKIFEENIIIFSLVFSFLAGIFFCFLGSNYYTDSIHLAQKIVCIINIFFSLWFIVLHFKYFNGKTIIKKIFFIYIIVFMIFMTISNIAYYIFTSQKLMALTFVVNFFSMLLLSPASSIFSADFIPENIRIFLMVFTIIFPSILIISLTIKHLDYRIDSIKNKLLLLNYLQAINYLIIIVSVSWIAAS